MRRVRRVLAYVLVFLLVTSLILTAVGVWFIRRPWPQVTGTIDVVGLSAPVDVVRDTWGVPHIYAETERDLVFAQGYVHAQDRLWQMEFNRRLGSGTLSAVLGEPTLGFDKLTRTMGLRRAAEVEWAGLDPDTRGLLEAYASGVNSFMETHRDRLPVEFMILGIDPAPWTPIDTLTWGKVMSWSLGWNYTSEVVRALIVAEQGVPVAQELMPPFKDGLPLAIPPEVQSYAWLRGAELEGLDTLASLLGGPNMSQGSNGWVIHGSRTATGKPILANDTHLYLEMPSGWYENGLHSGSLNVVGFSLPGVPMVIIGQNNRISWGITDLSADVQDLYIEQVNDKANPTQYQFKGEWHDLQVVPETIEVSNADPVTLNVRLTRHGPLMNDVLDTNTPDIPPLTLQWTVIQGAPLVKALLDINHATNWDEFRQGLRGWGAPSLNFLYADVDGNIGYQAAGMIPIRPATHQGLVPMPGASGQYEWQGNIPFDQLPTSFNPPSGFIANANSKVSADDDPHQLSYEWGDPYRIRRITEQLAANDNVTIADVQALQGDDYGLPAETLRPYLLAVTPEGPIQTRALELVKDWNMSSDSTQPGASIYHVWYWFLLQNTVQDDLSPELKDEYDEYFWLHASMLSTWGADPENHWFDDQKTPEVETRDVIARRSLADAVAWLSERYGDTPDQWQWGKLHTMTFVHRPLGQSGIGPVEWLFNTTPVPMPGDNFSVNAAWFNPDAEFVMSGGTAQRLIVDLSDLSKTQAIHTTGQTEQLFHPHRDDFIPLWQTMQYHPVNFTSEAVAAQAAGTLTLRPASQ